MRIGIIDLGTNTFNLLIVDITDEKYIKKVYKSNLPVKLGKEGFLDGLISPDAIVRGIEALKFHKNSINEHSCDKIFAFATSAIRSAVNGKDFTVLVKNKLDIDVQIISGDTEAELIYFGVKNAINLSNETVLIIDIGGGSTEFIIANNNKLFWKKSYPLGIARIIEKFHPADPISEAEILQIENYLQSALNDLLSEVSKYKIETLIGSSGSFDTFASMVSLALKKEKSENQAFYKISISDFDKLHNTLLKSTFSERANMEGLEPVRIEMIVLASIFTKFIIKKLNISKLYQSEYAIKEGIAFSFIQNELKTTHERI
ncbi:MAG: hypothetical protein A2046_08000 [Bacteroidetes bacterium GWA2_30_7]|nr:MAG: hypothetical protein A2046_08000 [Bacteroidetes bacterium GWA2_30_7]